MPYLLQCYRALMRTPSIFLPPFVATKGVLCCFQSTRHTNKREPLYDIAKHIKT